MPGSNARRLALGTLIRWPEQWLSAQQQWPWRQVHERFSGFATGQHGSGMHEFMCRKDRDGNVRLWLRQSSQASSWLPDGDGYLVFKSVPTGAPPAAMAKADAKWGRAQIESTVTQWFRYMGTDPAIERKIKADWESRFAALPPDGDVTMLQPAFKLRWAELPKHAPLFGRGVGGNVSAGAASGAMENPPVNPVTGPGRSASEVRAEVERYQSSMRATSAIVPIFQADFLFVRPTARDLHLARVVHGMCIRDAAAEDISFTVTEYEHHPQTGHQGFWGHFELKKNADYNPADRNTGTKFVRNQNVTRTDVVLGNVRVFEGPAPSGEGKVLRVSVESLRALAAACSEQPPVPAHVPATHTDEAAAPVRRRRTKKQRRGPSPDEGSDDHDDEDDHDVEEDDEDEAAPIPEGWEVQPWQEGGVVLDFMIWTSLDQARRTWHRMKVQRALGANRADGFTHDAVVHGQRGIRGVTLNAAGHSDGSWVAIRERAVRDAGEVGPPQAAPRRRRT